MLRFLAFLLSVCCLATLLNAAVRDWPDSRAVEDLTRNTATNTLDNGAFDNWTVFTSPIMERPVLGYGHPIAVNRNDPAGSALQLVLFATGSHGDFELQSTRAVGNVMRIFYREQYDGFPVLCGRADLVLNARGDLMRWSLRDYSDWPTKGWHALQPAAAATEVFHHLGGDWNITKSLSAWLPDPEFHVLLPVEWIWFAGPASDQRWEAIVNAATGDILFEWPGIQTDVVSAVVRGPFWQPYLQSEVQVGVHPHETVTVNGDQVTTNAEGEFSHEAGALAQLSTMLRGPYVVVTNEDAPAGELTLTQDAPFTEFNWDWQLTDASHPELNLFHHVEFIHAYYKVLDPDFSALDYPMPAVANVGSGYDNAYWNGFGIYFGSGSQYSNFAMFSDVIYHEYTHGVTDGIYPDGMLPYVGQSGALNEAWSDYFACTINGDPLMGDYMLGGNPHIAFRDLESQMIFPQNWVGEVHGDSPFISAPLWTIRALLGLPAADSLAHFARYALAETFFDYLVAVLETDDDDGDLSNGTPHAAVIYDAFGDHGIGPGSLPHFVVDNLDMRADGQGQSIGDGDRFMEQGETAQLTLTLRNGALLFPPPATDVQIAISTGDATVTIVNGNQFTETLPAGSSFDLSPVLLQMSATAPDHWVTINLDVSSNGGSVNFHQAIEFTLGTPHLLIVDDDPTSNVEYFVTSVVRQQDKIFDEVALIEAESLPADRYLGYGMVVWLSGNATGNVLTLQDRDWLTSFLQAGNKVVLSGQDIVDALNGSDFAQNVLQVQVQQDTVTSHAVTATAPPFTNGDWYLTTGTGGAANQRDQSSFLPFGSSSQACYYGRTGTGPVAGVSFANGNGLLFGFGMEAISGMSGSSNLANFMTHLYAWAGELLGDVRDPAAAAIPMEIGITSAYPNPFNSSTRIRYAAPVNGGAELLIYDVLGRLVQRWSLPAQTGTVDWSPAGSSGIYFAQLHWHDGQSAAVKLLQIR